MVFVFVLIIDGITSCPFNLLRGVEAENDVILPFNLLISGADKSSVPEQHPTKMTLQLILFFLFYFNSSSIFCSESEQEPSAAVHVGTALLCQVGSEVCINFEVSNKIRDLVTCARCIKYLGSLQTWFVMADTTGPEILNKEGKCQWCNSTAQAKGRVWSNWTEI